VANQIGELATLLYQIASCQSAHARLEAVDAEQFGQHRARVVEAQRLIEIGREQIVPGLHGADLSTA